MENLACYSLRRDKRKKIVALEWAWGDENTKELIAEYTSDGFKMNVSDRASSIQHRQVNPPKKINTTQ